MEKDPHVRRRNMQQCGSVLQRVLSHLGGQTGMKFTVLMGGIDPLDPDAGKFIASIHTGKTGDGQDFANVYSKFKSEVVPSFGQFLDEVFEPQEDQDMDEPLAVHNNVENREGSARQVDDQGTQQDDDEGTNDDEGEDGGAVEEDQDGVGGEEEVSQAPATYSPSLASNAIALARLPSPHLATSLTSNLAPPPVAQLASFLTSDLAIHPAANLATPLDAQHAEFATSPSTHLAIPPAANHASCATPPSAHPMMSIAANYVTPPTAQHLATSTVSSPTTDIAKQGVYTALLNSDAFCDWSDFGSSDWSELFASSDLQTLGSMSSPGLDSSASTVSVTNPGFDDTGVNQQSMFAMNEPNWNQNPFVPASFNFNGLPNYHMPPPIPPTPHAGSYLPQAPAPNNAPFGLAPTLPAPPGASNPSLALPWPADASGSSPSLPWPAGASIPLPILPPPPGAPAISLILPTPPVASSRSQILLSSAAALMPSPMLRSPPATSLHQHHLNPLCELNVTPAQVIPPTQPGVINLPTSQVALAESGTSSESLGRSKRKYIPSQRAQRDNAIGKENRVPPPTETESLKKPGK
ncbi:hypothetical protein JVT61DRAFT_1786 [Boletus reticuloceps]|uniref:Uncharacterized protein n=1 Tax=Boletus reticuloceps TaxID=495285 RepID=A0A8I2YPH0_9AGAM|nr:hypothetical protein JVT61DRAFT_1786 [Boletus reticuloceps]